MIDVNLSMNNTNNEKGDSMNWQFPLKNWAYEIPRTDHPGGFRTTRRNHVHEGVDLYTPVMTKVYAVEDGTVVAVEQFTGAWAEPPSAWWNNTEAVLIEGVSGVVVYGEILIHDTIEVDAKVQAGQYIGYVVQVLKHDKGRPQSMLHLELYRIGTRKSHAWKIDPKRLTRIGDRPIGLLDPTPYLINADRIFIGKDSATITEKEENI